MHACMYVFMHVEIIIIYMHIHIFAYKLQLFKYVQ